MTTPETFFLVQSLKRGDLKALEKIYKMYYPKLISFCRKFDSSTLEPEDFVQQTFLKVWSQRGQLKEDVLLDKQLFVICKNLISNHLLREKKMVVNYDTFSFSDSTDSQEEPSSLDRLSQLNAEINKLPKKRKEVFLLHKVENLSYQEIAQHLSISKKTIAQHIYLANMHLQSKLRNK